MTVLSWADVQSQLGQSPSLLLGNGFGRSLTESFSYGKLYPRVEKNLPDAAKQIFAGIGTADFEQVLRAVDHAEVVNKAHGLSSDGFETTRARIRTGLIEAVLAVHPEKRSAVDAKWQERARDLLHQFERIFTTNYDLLLYWLLISSSTDYCDGFGMQTGDLRFEKNYPYAHRYFYLHGALHLFTAQDDVRKVKAKRKSLRETLAETMAAHNYPLFISEGTHESKRRRIESSPYLRYALEQLCASRGTLVTFGLGFWENDLHIAQALCDAPELDRVFVGVHGGSPADVDRLSKVFGATRMADVRFFDTKGVL